MNHDANAPSVRRALGSAIGLRDEYLSGPATESVDDDSVTESNDRGKLSSTDNREQYIDDGP